MSEVTARPTEPHHCPRKVKQRFGDTQTGSLWHTPQKSFAVLNSGGFLVMQKTLNVDGRRKVSDVRTLLKLTLPQNFGLV